MKKCLNCGNKHHEESNRRGETVNNGYCGYCRAVLFTSAARNVDNQVDGAIQESARDASEQFDGGWLT